MKALFISSHYPKILRSVSDYTYHLSNTFVNKGIKTFVITSKSSLIIEPERLDIKIIDEIENWNMRKLQNTTYSTFNEI